MLEGVQVILISRSDPDQVVCITREGERLSRLEDLRRHNFFPRSDIALVNIWRDGKAVGSQHAVYATKKGKPTGSGLDFLNKSELTWVKEENRKLIEVAKKHPEFTVYLKN